jgi:hypothetical protein
MARNLLKARTTFDYLRGEIQAWSPDLNTVNAAPHADSRQSLEVIATQTEVLDKTEQKKLANTAIDRLVAVTKSHGTWEQKVKDQILLKKRHLTTVKSVIEAYRRMTTPVLEIARKAAQHGLQVASTTSVSGQKRPQGEDSKSDPKRAKPDKFERNRKKQNRMGPGSERVNAVTKAQGNDQKAKATAGHDVCTGCGRAGHSATNCVWKQHPDWNKSDSAWSESTNGKANKETWGQNKL